MIERTRKEWLSENRKLLVNVLEHITNVTNLGLSLHEENNKLIVSYPIKTYSKNDPTKVVQKADLIFNQDPNDGMKVKHQLNRDDNPIIIVAQVPPSLVNEKFIYEQVIDFLQKVNSGQ